MEAVIKSIRDWSEVWALLIPLAVMLRYRHINSHMWPVKWYVVIGLVLSLVSTIMYVYHNSLPAFLKNNNMVYNIHSLTRVILFSIFITSFRFGRRNRLAYSMMTLYALFAVINFSFWISPLQFSHVHFIAESLVLMSLCILFFFRSIRDDSDIDWIREPAFLVCAGISLYEAVNFFTFLFFQMLSRENLHFLKVTWTIHNITFVIFCSILAMALYGSRAAGNTVKHMKTAGREAIRTSTQNGRVST